MGRMAGAAEYGALAGGPNPHQTRVAPQALLSTAHSPEEEAELEEEAAVLLGALGLAFDPDACYHLHNQAQRLVPSLGAVYYSLYGADAAAPQLRGRSAHALVALLPRVRSGPVVLNRDYQVALENHTQRWATSGLESCTDRAAQTEAVKSGLITG